MIKNPVLQKANPEKELKDSPLQIAHPARVALRFPGILELIEFQIKVTTPRFEVNRTRFSTTGFFNQSDIDFAINGFGASIEDPSGF